MFDSQCGQAFFAFLQQKVLGNISATLSFQTMQRKLSSAEFKRKTHVVFSDENESNSKKAKTNAGNKESIGEKQHIDYEEENEDESQSMNFTVSSN